MSKKALITGITGQDGAYLSKLLLEKGYDVYGSYRRSSTLNLWRLKDLEIEKDVKLVCIELTDLSSIQHAVEAIQPDEIYNFAAQSFVTESFGQAVYTGDVDGLSVTRILEVIRTVNPKIKFYQASSSEMFGKVRETPQNEDTPFYPRSPYGAAKAYGHYITVNYRESYDLFAVSGILFNHESPLRGLEFVTRKITSAFASRTLPVELGNLNSKRDWGFAGDYVEGIWRMMQCFSPGTYVLATGRTATIRDFIILAAKVLDVDLVWSGSGLEEKAIDPITGETWVKINPQFYRPAEVDLLLGDPIKAVLVLGWEPKTSLEELVRMMIIKDLERKNRAATTLQ